MRTISVLAFTALLAAPAAAVEFAPNHVFVARSSSGVVEHDKNMNYFGTRGSSGATALAFGPNGHLYACCGVAGVEELDGNGIPVRYFLDSWLNYAAGIAFGPGGNLLVADINNDHLVEFDSSGTALRLIGSGSSLDGPFGIALGPEGHIFVSSNNNGRIVEFDARGNEIRVFGTTYLNQPQGIAFGPHGYLYVTEYGTNQLTQIDVQDGSEVSSIAAPSPRGICVAPDGRLRVTDQANGTVVTFAVDQWGTMTQEGWQWVAGSGTTGGIAYSPFRLKVVLNNTCESAFTNTTVKEKGTLSIFPGTGTVLLDLKPLLSMPFVGHGVDAFCSSPGKRRLLHAIELHSAPARHGASTIFLRIYGKVDGAGFFVVKDVTGDFARMYLECVIRASIKTIERLN